jgi:hypothetical protein
LVSAHGDRGQAPTVPKVEAVAEVSQLETSRNATIGYNVSFEKPGVVVHDQP